MAAKINSNGSKSSKIKRRLKIFALVFLASASVVCLTAFFVFKPHLDYAESLIPNLTTIMDRISSQPSVIESSDGETLYSVQSQYRRAISIENVPQVVINATIAAEDKRFYKHDGVDSKAMLNVLWMTLRNRSVPRGGSTLTMQLSKRVFTSPVQSFSRKLDDMALAIVMEQRLSKDQIIELYMNQIYYGESAYGIAAAAEVYFGKQDLKQLTLAEAALLVRIVRRPSDENPFDDLKTAMKNRDIVLSTMLEEKMISKDEYNKAKKEKPKLTKKKVQTVSGYKRAPYYVDKILRQFKTEFPDVDLGMGGYRIVSTLNYDLQKYAEEEIEKSVKSLKNKKVTTGALLLTDSDGAVLVHVGGADYHTNEFDVITQGRRQPGSSFKPFVYGTALDNHVVGPNDKISNDPVSLNMGNGVIKWVHNSDGVYGGMVTLQHAINRSLNVVATRLIIMTGPDKVVEKAHDSFGFVSKLEAYPSLALGATAVSPLEMTRAYSVFKNNGNQVEPYFIKRIIGPDDVEIKQYAPNIKKETFSPATARTMDTLLYGAAHHGTGASVTRAGVFNARGKTGTTNNYRDAWFCGYTNRFVAVGWVGGEVWNGKSWEYKSMNRVFGASVCVFWAKVMKKAQATYGEKLEPFVPYFMSGDAPPPSDPSDARAEDDPLTGASPIVPMPDEVPPIDDLGENTPPIEPSKERELDIIYVEVCAYSGGLATQYCPETAKKPFLRESVPKNSCPIHKLPE